MPKVRVRTTTKASWSSDKLEKAVKLIEEDGFSIRKAARVSNIPFSSLQNRYNNKNNLTPRLGRLTVFSADQEKQLADLIKKMANIFYGCTGTEIRKVAFEYAENLNLKHNFNQSSKMAGRDWLVSFMARNDISVRKPEATSINRIIAFNKTEVQRFYQLRGELMAKHKFVPKNMYNCDETGITTVQPPEKNVAAKGQKRVGSITSWERGKNITLMCAMNAAGGFIPPMFIFPLKRLNPLLEKDGPAGALYKCSDNGWINEQLFFEWLSHFKHHARPSAEEPVLLILDNHASHISLRIYEFCKINHIHMLSLPPHTSHKMQPLDVSFFGPLKGAYKKECDLYMKSHLAEKITPYEVASLLRKAFNNVASISKGESGFRETGIYPMNPDLFCEEDFLPAVLLQSETTAIKNVDESVAINYPAQGQERSPVPSTSMQVDSPLPPTPPRTSSAVDCPDPGPSSSVESSMGKTNNKDDAREKKRDRDRRRRDKIKNDPELYAQFRESERARYQRRKQDKKALPVSELPPQKQKEIRQRNRDASRSYYRRMKAIETINESKPEVTLPQQSEHLVEEKDPLAILALSPASKSSRYSLRSDRGGMNASETTILKDSRCSLKPICNESLRTSALIVPQTSTRLPTLSEPSTIESNLEQNLEEYSDDVIRENEAVSQRSSPTSCSVTTLSSANSNSSSTCYSESSNINRTNKRKITSPSRLMLRRYRAKTNKELNRLNEKINELKNSNQKLKKQIQRLRIKSNKTYKNKGNKKDVPCSY